MRAFPERGDHAREAPASIGRGMDAAAQILAHCLALDFDARRLPARERLDAELGPVLASQLVAALTYRPYR